MIDTLSRIVLWCLRGDQSNEVRRWCGWDKIDYKLYFTLFIDIWFCGSRWSWYRQASLDEWGSNSSREPEENTIIHFSKVIRLPIHEEFFIFYHHGLMSYCTLEPTAREKLNMEKKKRILEWEWGSWGFLLGDFKLMYIDSRSLKWMLLLTIQKYGKNEKILSIFRLIVGTYSRFSIPLSITFSGWWWSISCNCHMKSQRMERRGKRKLVHSSPTFQEIERERGKLKQRICDSTWTHWAKVVII